MLTAEQLQTYLNKLGCTAEVTLENLRRLHENHLMRIPFGSVSIHNGNLISQDPSTFFNKVIETNNSGVCFELNYSFYRLVKSLGFDANLHQAQAYKKDPTLKPNQARLTYKFSHMIVVININDSKYLCDVGNSHCIRHPLELKEHTIEEIDGPVELKFFDNHYHLLKTKKGPEYQYKFDMEVRQVDQYKYIFDYYNYNPHSWCMLSTCVTVLTPEGYKILIGTTFRNMKSVDPTKNLIIENLNIEQCLQILLEEFNIKQETYKPVEYVYKPDHELEITELQENFNIF